MTYHIRHISDTMLRLSYDNIWFYELIDRQLAAETVAQAQRRIATQTRQFQCALLTMSSSIFGAEQRISEPPCFSQQSTSQRNQRVNDIGHMIYSFAFYGNKRYGYSLKHHIRNMEIARSFEKMMTQASKPASHHIKLRLPSFVRSKLRFVQN